MLKFVCSFNSIIDANSEEDARAMFSNNIACEHEDTDVECFEYDSDAPPWGVKPSCEDMAVQHAGDRLKVVN